MQKRVFLLEIFNFLRRFQVFSSKKGCYGFVTLSNFSKLQQQISKNGFTKQLACSDTFAVLKGPFGLARVPPNSSKFHPSLLAPPSFSFFARRHARFPDHGQGSEGGVAGSSDAAFAIREASAASSGSPALANAKVSAFRRFPIPRRGRRRGVGGEGFFGPKKSRLRLFREKYRPL